MGGSVTKVFDKYRGVMADPAGLLGKEGAEQLSDPLGITGASARKQAKIQQVEIDKQEAIQAGKEKKLALTEAERKKRMRRAKQGRRSLLYTGGDEKGVRDTLGE